MAIPSMHSSSPTLPSKSVDSNPSIQPGTLLVGELTIGGRSYTVSIESSESLISTPTPSTQEKIKYLADLHLKHLKSQGADLSKIVLQQIDEEGLSYVSLLGDNEMKEEMLPSSNIEFISYNPFEEEELSFPPSLQNLSIASVKQIYDSIIDPLLAKNGEGKKAEILPITSKESRKEPSRVKKSDPRIIFTQNPEETLVKTIDSPISNSISRNPKNKESVKEVSKQEDSSAEIENSKESKLTNLWERAWRSTTEWLPSFSRWKSGSYDVIDSAKIVEEEKESFLQANPQVREDLKKFESINLQ